MLAEMFSVCLQCGYWKDLLEILVRLCVGEEEWEARVEAAEEHKDCKGVNVKPRKAAKKERLKEWRTSLRSLKDPDARQAAKSERAAANAGWNPPPLHVRLLSKLLFLHVDR